MTCPSLMRRRPGGTDTLGDLPHGPLHEVGEAARTASERARRDDTLGQFVRFVLVGGTSTAVYALLFLALGWLGYLPAHVVATVASSVLANELHRRLTFRAGERVDWLTAQWEGGALAAAGIVATSVALGWLTSVVGPTEVVVQLVLVGAVTGTIGLLRFVALRWAFGARDVETV